MGFKKYVRKQGRRLKGWAKKRYVPGGKLDVARIAKDVAYVKGVLNVERKYFDTTEAQFALPSSATPANWNVYCLNRIAQGNGISQRSGASVRLKSLQIKGRIELGGAVGTATLTSRAHRVRIVLLQDKEINGYNAAGQFPTATEVYTSFNVDAMRNFDSVLMRRYKVMMSKIITLNNDKPEYIVDIFRRLSMVQKWATTDTTGVNITQHPLYLCVISDHAVGDTPPQMSFTSRITYVDN